MSDLSPVDPKQPEQVFRRRKPPSWLWSVPGLLIGIDVYWSDGLWERGGFWPFTIILYRLVSFVVILKTLEAIVDGHLLRIEIFPDRICFRSWRSLKCVPLTSIRGYRKAPGLVHLLYAHKGREAKLPIETSFRILHVTQLKTWIERTFPYLGPISPDTGDGGSGLDAGGDGGD